MARFKVEHFGGYSVIVDTQSVYAPIFTSQLSLIDILNLDQRDYEQKIATLTAQLAERDAELAKLRGAAVGVRTAEWCGIKYRQEPGGRLEVNNGYGWIASEFKTLEELIKCRHNAVETTPKPARYVLTVEEPGVFCSKDGIPITPVPLSELKQ